MSIFVPISHSFDRFPSILPSFFLKVLASKGHLAVCGALARKSVAAWDETAEDKKHQQILHNGPPPRYE